MPSLSSLSSPPGPSKPAASVVADTAPSSNPNAKKHYVCDVCSRAFSTTGHLARHSRVHTGERNHKCPFPGCETKCSRQDNLQQHYRIHLSPGSRRRSGRTILRRSQSTPEPSPPAETEPNSPSSSASASYRDDTPPLEPPPLEDSRIYYLRANGMAGTDTGNWVEEDGSPSGPETPPPLVDAYPPVRGVSVAYRAVSYPPSHRLLPPLDTGFDRGDSPLSEQAYWSPAVASTVGEEGYRSAYASPVASTSSGAYASAYTSPTASASTPASAHYSSHTSSPPQYPASQYPVRPEKTAHPSSPPFQAHAYAAQSYDHSLAHHAQSQLAHHAQPQSARPQPAQPQPTQHAQPQPAQHALPQPAHHAQPHPAHHAQPQPTHHPHTFRAASHSPSAAANAVPVSRSLAARHSFGSFAHLLTQNPQHPALDPVGRHALNAYAHQGQGLPPAYAQPEGTAEDAYPPHVSPSPRPSSTSTHSPQTPYTPFHEPAAVAAVHAQSHLQYAYNSEERYVHAETDYAYQDAAYARDPEPCAPAYPESCTPAYHTQPAHESARTAYDPRGHIVVPQYAAVLPNHGHANPDAHAYTDTRPTTSLQAAALSRRESYEAQEAQEAYELSMSYAQYAPYAPAHTHAPFLHHPQPQPPMAPPDYLSQYTDVDLHNHAHGWRVAAVS